MVDIRSAFSSFIEAIKRRLGILRVFKVYMYVVRISGYVLPPKEVRKKSKVKMETVIQWELSFEERPFFRTFTENHKDAVERYSKDLSDLVSRQEDMARIKRAFTWFKEVEVEELSVSQKTIDEYLKGATPAEIKKYEEEKKLYMYLTPTFIITAIDFEPVDVIEVPEDRIKERRAEDECICKLYRPNEEEEYMSWKDKFEHDL